MLQAHIHEIFHKHGIPIVPLSSRYRIQSVMLISQGYVNFYLARYSKGAVEEHVFNCFFSITLTHCAIIGTLDNEIFPSKHVPCIQSIREK